MPIAFRVDLTSFLTEFAERHRGVRLGKMFGLPALYVGRRLVACLMEEGVIVRLPDDVARREVRSKRATPYSRKGRIMGSWVMYTPRSAEHARPLTPIVELATRHVAERMTQELTGVKLTPRKGR